MERKKIYKYIVGVISISIIAVGITSIKNKMEEVPQNLSIEEILDDDNKYKILDIKEDEYLLTRESSFWSNKKDKLYLYNEVSEKVQEIAEVDQGAYTINYGTIQDERIIFMSEVKFKRDGSARRRQKRLGYGSIIFEIKRDEKLEKREVIKDVGEYQVEDETLVFKDYVDGMLTFNLMNLEEGYRHKIFEGPDSVIDFNMSEDTIICSQEDKGIFTVLDIGKTNKNEAVVTEVYSGVGEGYLYEDYVYMLEEHEDKENWNAKNLIRINTETKEKEIVLDGSKEWIPLEETEIEAINGKLIVTSNVRSSNGEGEDTYSFRGYVDLEKMEVVNLASKEGNIELIGDKLLFINNEGRSFIELD